MKSISELNKLYLRAKDAYYNMQPFMSDSEFDELESKLKELNSDVIYNVGSFDRYSKTPHPTMMKSLDKIQADKENGLPPTEDFITWFYGIYKNIDLNLDEKSVKFEVEPKLDGNAVNLVYENGILTNALSRGNGILGRDYINKIDKKQIPLELDEMYHKSIVEIRCEAVIDKKKFAKKHSKKFSNERNYVAGVLNSDNPSDIDISEIDLVPVEMKETKNNETIYHEYSTISTLGFLNDISDNYDEISIYPNDKNKIIESFNELFYKYKKYKDSFKYRIDGMVFKVQENKYRNQIGELKHHPKWAIAVKFKPEDCITEIVGFEMTMGKTGNFTPVALLKPVDLDGSIVSKASAYNYDFIAKNSLNVGSLVTLVKSGDIIPQIVNVVTPSSEPYNMPTHCPYCGTELVLLNGKHIHCPNNECMGKKLQKFINSFNTINLYGVGDSFITDLFYHVSDSAKWYFVTDINEVSEKVKNKLGDGKIVINFLERIKETKEITIQKAISFLSYDGISDNGKTVSEIAKKISGIPYNFSGLEKKVIDGWDIGEGKYNSLMSFIDELDKNGITVSFLELNEAKSIKLCLTGSPKSFGYKTKDEYINKLRDNGLYVEIVSVKDADYIITDDINSTSSKMKQAIKLGKKIKTYSFNNY